MTPLTDSQVIELAHVYAIRWKMNRTDTDLLTSLLRRVYAEGRLSGTQDMSKELRVTLDSFKSGVKHC